MARVIKYAVKQVGPDKFYPMVKEVETNVLLNLFFSSNWKRIGVHSNEEFGLYSDLRYPYKNEKEAVQVVNKYKKYLNKLSTEKVRIKEL